MKILYRLRLFTLLFTLLLCSLFSTRLAAQVINLGTLGADANGNSNSYAYGINNSKQVCGQSDYYVHGVDKGPRAVLFGGIAVVALDPTTNFDPTKMAPASTTLPAVGPGVPIQTPTSFTITVKVPATMKTLQ